jgi:hypothetical protein
MAEEYSVPQRGVTRKPRVPTLGSSGNNTSALKVRNTKLVSFLSLRPFRACFYWDTSDPGLHPGLSCYAPLGLGEVGVPRYRFCSYGSNSIFRNSSKPCSPWMPMWPLRFLILVAVVTKVPLSLTTRDSPWAMMSKVCQSPTGL